MRQLAVYGKGGIGKSTISANLSVALAEAGYKVMQIGCDPKHDSTRTLLGGTMQETVLDQLKFVKSPTQPGLEDIVKVGYRGIKCVEAGGPEPGVGCAGRGIISMFSTLEALEAFGGDTNLVLYDVLGDVVCGGFAAPIREGYAQEIYIVTSGEFMALYAANNIAKGLTRYRGEGPGRLGGILGNSRGIPREWELLKAFAHRLGTRLIQFFPRDELFRAAEVRWMTAMEYAPDSPLAGLFREAACTIAESPSLSDPKPFSHVELEDFVAEYLDVPLPPRPPRGTTAVASAASTPASSPSPPREGKAACEGGDRLAQVPLTLTLSPSGGEGLHTGRAPRRSRLEGDSRYQSKARHQNLPYHSCSLNGAYNMASQLGDAITVMHSPTGCANMNVSAMTLSAVGAELRGAPAPPAMLAPNVLCSSVNETDVVFGAEEKLERFMVSAWERHRPAALALITACPSAIIGEDAGRVVRRVGAAVPVPVINLPTGGVNGGDYAQGQLNAATAIGRALIDPGLAPEPDAVNLVAEDNISNIAEHNFAEVKRLLGALGLRVSCRFLHNTTVASVRGFRRGRLNLLMGEGEVAAGLRRFLAEEFGAAFLEAAPPVGLHAACAWVEAIAKATDRVEAGAGLIERMTRSTHEAAARLRRRLKGKRAMVLAYEQDLDWLLLGLRDLEVEVLKVHLFESCLRRGGRSEAMAGVPVAHSAPGEAEAEVRKVRPDLALVNYLPRDPAPGVVYEGVPLLPPLGASAVLGLAERWAGLLAVPFMEGWRRDAALFG